MEVPRGLTLELPGGVARLEPLERRHAPALLEIAGEDGVWRYLPEARARTLSEMEAFVDRAVAAAGGGAAREGTGGEFPFAIVHRPSGAVAGSTRYLDIQARNRALEIGWTWLSARFQRTGVNTECKYLLLRHAFEVMGAGRVQLKCDGRNEQSQRAILRIGARYEGTLRKNRVMPDGYVRDSVYFSIVEGEWAAVRARLESMFSPPAAS